MIDRRVFFTRFFGGAAAVNIVVAAGTYPPAVPSCCLVVSKDDPHNAHASSRYHTLRALALDMEARDEALFIENTGR